jgi:hypothetical protein
MILRGKNGNTGIKTWDRNRQSDGPDINLACITQIQSATKFCLETLKEYRIFFYGAKQFPVSQSLLTIEAHDHSHITFGRTTLDG